MYRTLAISAYLASLAAVVTAQSFALGGVGRFPCTAQDGSADQAMCATGTIADPNCPVSPSDPDYGNVNGAGFKNYGAIPTGSQCFGSQGNFYCGVAGATCTTDDNCDNGSCSGGVCTGGLGSPCTLDSECSGSIYCLNSAGGSTAVGGGASVCGFAAGNSVNGATCDDGCAAGNFLCLSNVCDGTTGACFATAAGASQRARARRTLALRDRRCPAAHTACSVPGSLRGFECIDTSSNLEQCGACASAGGVDCTSLPGVDAMGCVAGKCEVWSCADGFLWDAKSSSCISSV